MSLQSLPIWLLRCGVCMTLTFILEHSWYSLNWLLGYMCFVNTYTQLEERQIDSHFQWIMDMYTPIVRLSVHFLVAVAVWLALRMYVCVCVYVCKQQYISVECCK
jgi:hypothetical protein